MNNDEELPQENPVNKTLEEGGLKEQKSKKVDPVYKMIGEERIPISQSAGKLWKARFDHAESLEKDAVANWKECLDYYENTAAHLRGASDGSHARNHSVRGTHNKIFSEIENVVFSHVSSIVPHIYSQNPTIEITPVKSENEPLARAMEELAKAFIIRKSAPNLKLKQLIRKMIVVSILCKNSYAVITWTGKNESSEQAQTDLRTLSKQMQDAKTPQQIKDVEGKLMALEQTIDFLSPSGPKISFRLPWEIKIDPASRDEDGDDAQWMMVADMLPWSFVKARYMKSGKDGKSVYQPTHILRSATNDADDTMMNDFSLFSSDEGSTYKEYGFDDEETFERAQYMKVWTVYDRAARRVYLYSDKDWTWPLWVWDDPYGLQTFFNVVPMSNYTSPVRTRGKGEIAYILDQQDSINEANDGKSRARHSMLHNIVYNSKKISAAQVSNLLEPGSDSAIGIALDDGQTISDHITAFAPPIMGIPQLLDKSDSYDTIDRILGTNEVMRGGQFKTNATNDAVSAETAVTKSRLDEKTDIVEDAVGNIIHKVLEMAVQFMGQTDVIDLIGDKHGAAWRTMTPQEFSRNFSLQIVGGSTAKPTSAHKQQQALDIGQVLGQFASGSPVTLLIILKVFERSFNEVVMTDEDWTMLIQSIEAQIQGPSGGEGGSEGGGDPLAAAMKELPPEAQQAVQQAIDQGVPPEQAIARVTEALQQQQPAV